MKKLIVITLVLCCAVTYIYAKSYGGVPQASPGIISPLPISGGTMTGNIVMGGNDLTAAGNITTTNLTVSGAANLESTVGITNNLRVGGEIRIVRGGNASIECERPSGTPDLNIGGGAAIAGGTMMRAAIFKCTDDVRLNNGGAFDMAGRNTDAGGTANFTNIVHTLGPTSTYDAATGRLNFVNTNSVTYFIQF